MRAILKPEIGQIYDDMQCIGIKNKRQASGFTANVYVMKCIKCGREKKMLSSTIRNHKGTTHKSCGRGLKTVDPVFYSRWQAMRTRTENENYQHADCYSMRGINSDEFKNFIDFYDAMYGSYLVMAEKIGKENTSLERIDVNKPYTKENCEWIDKHRQQGNTRKNIKFEVTFPDGHTEIHTNAREFAREHGLDVSTIQDVMNPNRSTSQHKGYKFRRL